MQRALKRNHPGRDLGGRWPQARNDLKTTARRDTGLERFGKEAPLRVWVAQLPAFLRPRAPQSSSAARPPPDPPPLAGTSA